MCLIDLAHCSVSKQPKEATWQCCTSFVNTIAFVLQAPPIAGCTSGTVQTTFCNMLHSHTLSSCCDDTRQWEMWGTICFLWYSGGGRRAPMHVMGRDDADRVAELFRRGSTTNMVLSPCRGM